MHSDDCSDSKQFYDLLATYPDFPIPHKRYPEKRAKRGEQTAPRHKNRSADGSESTQNGGGRKNDHKQMKLESDVDGECLVGCLVVGSEKMGFRL